MSSFSPSECLRGLINLGVFIVFFIGSDDSLLQTANNGAEVNVVDLNEPRLAVVNQKNQNEPCQNCIAKLVFGKISLHGYWLYEIKNFQKKMKFLQLEKYLLEVINYSFRILMCHI